MYYSANENGLKWIEIFFIRMRILNSEYFFGFNWIQFDLIRFNWMQLDWKTAFPIQNFELNSIHSCVCCVFICTEKANIIFTLKGIEICNSYKWIQMHSGLKCIHFNIRESIFLKIWIHFNSFQSILVCWTCF